MQQTPFLPTSGSKAPPNTTALSHVPTGHPRASSRQRRLPWVPGSHRLCPGNVAKESADLDLPGHAEPTPPQADSSLISVRKCRAYCTQLYHLLMPPMQNSPRRVTVPYFRKRSQNFFPLSLFLLPGEKIKLLLCEERKLNYCFHIMKPIKKTECLLLGQPQDKKIMGAMGGGHHQRWS